MSMFEERESHCGRKFCGCCKLAKCGSPRSTRWWRPLTARVTRQNQQHAKNCGRNDLNEFERVYNRFTHTTTSTSTSVAAAVTSFIILESNRYHLFTMFGPFLGVLFG